MKFGGEILTFLLASDNFDKLYGKVVSYLSGKEIFVRDSYACADPNYKLNIRVVNEYPWSNMFAYNMFLRPTTEELVELFARMDGY